MLDVNSRNALCTFPASSSMMVALVEVKLSTGIFDVIRMGCFANLSRKKEQMT
jgi:hypothetical protein